MEHLNTSNNTRLEGVQVLRAFAVMIVVLSHFSIIIKNQTEIGSFITIFTQNSPFAVDLFFFISGFIMVFTTKGNIKSNVLRASDFLIKRLFRIFPVYYLCLAVFVIFVTLYDKSYSINDIPVKDIVKSFFLIPLSPPDKSPFYGYSLIVPAWTITYEIYFYVIFSIALLLTSKYRTIVCSSVLVAVALILQLYFNGRFTIDAQDMHLTSSGIIGNFSFIANPIIFDFILGMFLGEFFISKLYLRMKSIIDILAPAFLCFGATAFISMFRYGYGLTHSAIGAFFLLFAILHFDFKKSIIYPRALIFIGNISYSLYISHVVVINIADRYSNALYVYTQSSGWRRYFVIIILAITIATLMHKLIEIPSTKVAKSIIEKLKKNLHS